MPCKISQEETVTLHVLKAKGQSNSEIARTLGVSEGAVRYRVRRRSEGAGDGRRNKRFKAEAVAGVVDEWFRAQKERREEARPVNVQDLYDFLVEAHDYEGSYKSVLRFARARYPRPRIRPYRRVETPAGAQAQVDWGEFTGVDIGDGPQKLYAFVMVLSHSRRPAVIWSLRTDQLAWHHVHNEALRRLDGVAAADSSSIAETEASGMGSSSGPVTTPEIVSPSASTKSTRDDCGVRVQGSLRGALPRALAITMYRLSFAEAHGDDVFPSGDAAQENGQEEHGAAERKPPILPPGTWPGFLPVGLEAVNRFASSLAAGREFESHSRSRSTWPAYT